MKFLFTFLSVTCFWLASFATAQYPDKIIFKGKEYNLYSNPLETYFEKYPEKRPHGPSSTALWRGYIATFEIRDSQLYVKDIAFQHWITKADGTSDTELRSVMDQVFPGQKDIKVDWLTGLLVLPYGKLINYVHMGYGSTYENYFLLEIANGKFVKQKQFGYKKYEQFKEKQFQAFKQTEEYKKAKADLKSTNSSDEFIDKFLKDFVVQYTSKILVD